MQRPSSVQRPCDNRGGYILLLTVLIVAAVTVAASVSILTLSASKSKGGVYQAQSQEARFLADACAEEGLQQIVDSVPFSGSGVLNIGNGSCGYTVTKLAGQDREIESIGTVGTVVRKVFITIDTVRPSLNVATWQEVADF